VGLSAKDLPFDAPEVMEKGFFVPSVGCGRTQTIVR
jgi:hypothetical protein